MTTIAVIGCGRIANLAHFPAFEKIDNVRIKYACDLIESKAQEAKEKFPKIENVITDYNIALNDPEVEAVFVLTPNIQHYTITMDALKAGKHVFCEKPITVSYDKAAEMAAAAKKYNKLVNIGVCNRYHLSVEKLAEMNRNGEFGKLYHVVCSFRACRSIPGLGGSFTTKAISGGGVLIDWGVHFIDLILYVLGNPEIKTVSADTYSEMAKDMASYKCKDMWARDTADIENGTNDVDDFVAAHIRTDGASITLNGAWAQNLDKKEMYIDFLGDKAGVRLTYCGLYELFHGDTLETETPEYEIPDMYAKEDYAFLEAVKTGEHTKSYIDNILPAAKIMQAMYDSSDKQKEIKF